MAMAIITRMTEMVAFIMRENNRYLVKAERGKNSGKRTKKCRICKKRGLF